ncbi:M23 family metallopeptidase [Chroococcidiopsis sp.]|uniref:M23 family metallopeptidase n=1 Tax=Chroococcidiopsis sp. TaxID=3088168 RepID=UPI003F39571E
MINLFLVGLMQVGYQMPIEGKITSPVGPRNVFGYPQIHRGTDIACRKGDPIAAAEDGIVTFSGYYRSSGNMVRIEHLDGNRTLYMHLDTLTVQKNQRVSQGQTIGTCGSKGQSTGDHLHFEIQNRDGNILAPKDVL